MRYTHIITAVMRREGWDTYTNHPADRGGPTKWGITAKAWGDWTKHPAGPEEVQAITQQQARDFYAHRHVFGPKFNQLPESCQELVIDCGVHHGPRRASKWVQRAVGAKQDKVIGPQTLAAVAKVNELTLFLRVLSYRIKLFGRLVSGDPVLKEVKRERFRLQAEFAAGWNNRAADFALQLADELNQGDTDV